VSIGTLATISGGTVSFSGSDVRSKIHVFDNHHSQWHWQGGQGIFGMTPSSLACFSVPSLAHGDTNDRQGWE